MSRPDPSTWSTAQVAGHVNHAMRDFARANPRRRNLPRRLWLGIPRAETLTLAEEEWFDDGLRTDLVAGALDRLDCPAPLAWITRAGPLLPEDGDLRWLAAVRRGYARHGLTLPGFHLVTRCGWADLLGNARHEWTRIRTPGA